MTNSKFRPPFNIPADSTTLKLQVAVRGVGVAPSVAVHVTGLVPTGKEPWYWLVLSVRLIWVLLGDIAVHTTVGVPQLSWPVGRVNVTTVFVPVDAWLIGCVGQFVKVGAVVSGAVERKT